MVMIKTMSYEEELKKNPDLKEADIDLLRQWCSKQFHLPKISDSELALFLHSNYYRVEPTKNTIDTFYTCRTHVPEFFANRDPIGTEEIRAQMKSIFVMPLKKTTENGYQIIVSRLIDFDPSAFRFNDMMKYFNMVLDLWMFSTGCINGHIIVIDFQGVGLAHATRVSPLGVKKYLFYLQEALPVRLKGLHFTNSVPAVDIILNMMKPFMKKELTDMLHVHTDVNGLAKFIPREALPNEMGGTAGPMMELHHAQVKKLEENRAWFQQDEENSRVDESQRPGKAKSASDLFGVEGSFKKLEID